MLPANGSTPEPPRGARSGRRPRDGWLRKMHAPAGPGAKRWELAGHRAVSSWAPTEVVQLRSGRLFVRRVPPW